MQRDNSPARQTANTVLRAQLGDRAALEALLRDTRVRLQGYVRGLMRSPQRADDVLQEVLITIFRQLPWLQDPRAYGLWSYRIATRTALRCLRRDRRTAVETMGTEPQDPQSGFHLPADWADPLWTAMSELSPNTRAVVVLHYREGLTLARIADVLDLPVGTVKSRLAAGLQTLRRQQETNR